MILTFCAGCDNVAWEGVEAELRPPPAASALAPPAETSEEAATEVLEPVELGPLVYLVERADGDRGRILPVAVRENGEYTPLPHPDEVSDLVRRFPIGRWETGTEFVLFSQGVRAGILTTDGSSAADSSLCLPRAVGGGVLELRPGLPEEERFVAVPRAARRDPPSPLESHPGLAMDDDLRNASLDAAQNLIARLDIPWPPSVLGIRQRIDVLPGPGEERWVAASFVFGDELEVGNAPSTAYSLFLVTREGEEGFAPSFSWYQRRSADGKAFPGFLAAHDVRTTGAPDVFLEVFGVDTRGLAILEASGEEWELAYTDPCASRPGSGALQTWE